MVELLPYGTPVTPDPKARVHYGSIEVGNGLVEANANHEYAAVSVHHVLVVFPSCAWLRIASIISGD